MHTTSAKQAEAVLNREVVLPRGRGYRIAKRIQDVILSALVLFILWPFLLVIAVIIVIDSPGAGPIYSQHRGGLDGKPFVFYKFRTMHPGADKALDVLLPYNEMDGPVFKMKADPRITRVGKFLRRSGLDELPQLWNVLRGDMSIVGPRPALLREIEQYDAYERQRLSVMPGLTCYWQIQPNRNGMSFREWVALDLDYIAQRSYLTDWKIILKTFGAMIGMNGI